MQRRSVARTFHMTQRKRWVFSRFLTVAKLSDMSGSELQTVGAETEKAWLAKTVRVRGTASLGAWLDCSGREGTCGTSSDWRYAGVNVDLYLVLYLVWPQLWSSHRWQVRLLGFSGDRKKNPSWFLEFVAYSCQFVSTVTFTHAM